MRFAKRHIIAAEKLVYVSEQAFCGISEIDRVLCFQLTYNLFGKDVVERVKFPSPTAYVYGYIRFYLLHNTVTERYVEMLDKVFIKLVKSVYVSAAYTVLVLRFCHKLAKLL